MAKPKEVFYVEQTGTKLRYGQRGGGLFARLAGALDRQRMCEQQGGTAKVWRAEVVWHEVSNSDDLD